MAQSWAGRTWDRVVVIIDREGMMLRGLRVRFLWQSGELMQSVWQEGFGRYGWDWRGWLGDLLQFPQKFPVPQRNPSCTVYLDSILVMILAFHDCACPFPPSGIRSHLVLKEHLVAQLQPAQLLGVLCPSLVVQHVALSHGVLPVLEQLLPRVVRVVLSWQDWHAISDLSAEYC